MKKVLLAMLCVPFGLLAQSNIKSLNTVNLPPDQDKPVLMTPETMHKKDVHVPTTPARVNQPGSQRTKQQVLRQYDIKEEQIGSTTYDLQTNNAMPRRVLLHEDGTVSVVWTYSSNSSTTAGFPDRGTGYNYFNGTIWVGQNLDRFEAKRAGWPNIAAYDSAGIEKELIVSHYASGSTTAQESGGTFWMTNDQVGSTDFDLLREVDVPDGPYWPRVASADGYVHMIGVYGSSEPNWVVKAGVRNPIVYYRYDIANGTFLDTAITLPGYDSTRYGQGTADVYDIDARDSIVAVLISGPVSDVALFKSTDYGQTWTKTIVDSFSHAPYDFYVDSAFDTTFTNDGTGTLVIDRSGDVHVFYPRMRVLNDDVGDTSYTFFPGTNGIIYWNDNAQTNMLVAQTLDLGGNGQLDLFTETTARTGASYNTALSSMPSASVDANNNVYMVYSAPNELEEIQWVIGTLKSMNPRDVYVVASQDGGQTWTAPQNLTDRTQDFEDVFASVSRDADSNLHVAWMRDEAPGIHLVNEGGISLNRIMYASVPVDDILGLKIDSLYDDNTAIKEMAYTDVQASIYPNPADDVVTLALNVGTATFANIRVVDMLGKVMSQEINTSLKPGMNIQAMDVSRFKPGVYFIQVNTAGSTSSNRLLVE